MKRSLLGGATCAALLLTLGACADMGSGRGSSGGGMASAAMSSSSYVMAAGQSDQFEIQSGQLASQMGSSSGVKSFGAEMITDHTKSTAIVKAAAMKSGMPDMPPPPLRADQQQMMSQLKSMSGTDFDRTYVKQQMQAHQEALMLQQGYARNGDDPNLKAAAAQIVPVVQMHIGMLKDMGGHS